MIGDAVSAATSILLIALFAAILRCQFYTRQEFLRQRSPLGLLRQYRLFSPVPVRTDIHLVVRDFDHDGTSKRCRELRMTPLRRWTDLLWNPSKRRWLPLRALMSEVISARVELEDCRAAVEVSTAYLVLLGIVSAEPAAADICARQFLLIERFGHEPEDDPVVLFCSAIHRLDRPVGAFARRTVG